MVSARSLNSTYPSSLSTEPLVKPGLHQRLDQEPQQYTEEAEDAPQSVPLDEGLAEVVAVGKDASNPPQVDPGGCRKMEYRAVIHRATVYREISGL